MKGRVLLCISVAVFAAFTLTAQVMSLPFEEAMRTALKNNVDLRQEENILLSQHVLRTQSLANFFPYVALRGSAQHSEGQQPNPDGGDLQDLSNDNIQAQLSASLTIFNGFRRINTYAGNVALYRAQTSLLGRTKQTVIYDVTNQYLQVLLDQELLRIAVENHSAQNTVLERLREQVRLGLRPEVDLYTQEAQVRNMESIVLQAKVTLDNDKATLAQIIQLDISEDFNVVFPGTGDDYFDFEGRSLDTLYGIGLANREDLKQAQYEAESYRRAHAAAFGGYLPQISLFAAYGSQYYSALTGPVYDGFKNQFTRIFPTLSYGVSVEIPLFDRLVTRSDRVTTEVAYQNSVLRQQNLKKTIRIQIQRAYNNYHTAILAREASELQFKSAELALKTQEEGYRLGSSDQVALAQANQLYVQAAAAKAQADVTLLFQGVLLGYAVGTLNPAEYTDAY